jgi:hypothetical protein
MFSFILSVETAANLISSLPSNPQSPGPGICVEDASLTCRSPASLILGAVRGRHGSSFSHRVLLLLLVFGLSYSLYFYPCQIMSILTLGASVDASMTSLPSTLNYSCVKSNHLTESCSIWPIVDLFFWTLIGTPFIPGATDAVHGSLSWQKWQRWENVLLS